MVASVEVTTEPYSSTRRLAEYCRRIMIRSAGPQRRLLALVTVALVLGIGGFDYLLGFEVSLLVFYCVPVMLAVTALGWRFGALIAFASVVTWIGGDIAAGADYRHRMVLWWNGGIALGTYLVVVWLFHIVQTLQRDMEARVCERTAALTTQIRERERLEKAVLEISERERRSIGHDLHDGLGQHLTGTAFAGQVLCEKLQVRGLAEEEADAWKIVQLVEDGIEKTRRLANGLLLAEIQRDGLVNALQEFATQTSGQFRIECSFRAEGDCDLPEAGVATHLLRIAQEAVRNGIRHGSARRVEVEFVGAAEALTLRIRDNGSGIPPSPIRSDGLGLRIMAHRARMIGGEFAIAAATGGGTVVTCRLPRFSNHG